MNFGHESVWTPVDSSSLSHLLETIVSWTEVKVEIPPCPNRLFQRNSLSLVSFSPFYALEVSDGWVVAVDPSFAKGCLGGLATHFAV